MSSISAEMSACLIDATRDVFETMVGSRVSVGEPIEGDSLRPTSNVVGTVAFAGETSGLVAFYSTMDAARSMAGSMLGIPTQQVDGEMPDAIGELTNMIAGSFRTKMSQFQTRWAISVPTVTVGSDFYTKYVSDVQRILFPFHMGEFDIFVELIITRT